MYLIIEYDHWGDQRFVLMDDLNEIKKKYKVAYDDDGKEWNAIIDTSDWQQGCTMRFDIVKLNKRSGRLIAHVYPETE